MYTGHVDFSWIVHKQYSLPTAAIALQLNYIVLPPRPSPPGEGKRAAIPREQALYFAWAAQWS